MIKFITTNANMGIHKKYLPIDKNGTMILEMSLTNVVYFSLCINVPTPFMLLI